MMASNKEHDKQETKLAPNYVEPATSQCRNLQTFLSSLSLKS